MNCLRDQPIKEQPARFGRPAVESKSVFIQIIVQVRILHGSLVSPQQPSLQQRCDSVGQWKKVVPQVWNLANDLVLVTQSCQTVVSPPAIRMHFRARLNHLLNSRFEAFASGIGHSAQANSTDAFFGLLGRNDHQCLVRCSTAPLPRTLSSNEDFIHLDHAGEPIPSRADHGPPKFVQPLPRGMITPQPQNPLQAQRAHTVLLARDIPHGFKPKAQGLVRVVKQGARSRRNLVTTRDAPELPALHRPSLDGSAPWANKSIRPSQLGDVVPARCFSSKPIAKFDNRLRIRFHRRNLAENQQASSA